MEFGASLFAAGRPRDELGDHRIEIRWDFHAGLDPGVDTQLNAVGGRKLHSGQQARARLEITPRIFRVQTCLNRMALRFQALIQLVQRRQITSGQLDHPAHQIHVPHLFSNAVLDLQARVHFEKIEALGLAVEDEFDGAGAAVIHRLRQFDRRCAQLIGHAFGQVRRRGFFEDFLVAPLHRTVAHAESDDFTAAVAEHLHFQMPRAFDVLLDEHPGVAEVVLTEAFHRFE